MVKKLISSVPFQFLSMVFIVAGMVVGYNNCARLGGFESSESMDISITHPGDTIAPLSATTVQHHLSEKEYTSELMRSIFIGSQLNRDMVDLWMDRWVETQGHFWGGGCNVYDTHSTRACGPSFYAPNFPGQGTPELARQSGQVPASVIRESYRIQTCEGLIGTEAGLNSALEKIERGAVPTAESIAQIYNLFYRGDDIPQSVLQVLLDMDRSLALRAATEVERWRMQLLVICESPGWQVL